MEKYEILEQIGEGTYGKVVKAQHKETKQYFAIKKIKNIENPQVKKIYKREIAILKSLQHPNIVSLIETHSRHKKIYLVFEYVDHTLLEVIQKSSMIDIQTAKRIVFQLLLALNYCHSLGIIHRDIKPENLLLTAQGDLKLCDFGFARKLVDCQKMTQYVSTRWYRAPELLVGGKNYSFPVDVWAVGCVFYEMVLSKPLFPGINDADTLAQLIKVCGKLTESLEVQFKSNKSFLGLDLPKFSFKASEKKFRKFPFVLGEVIKRCLDIHPENRPTCEELLNHPLFEDILKENLEKGLNGPQYLVHKSLKRNIPNNTPEPLGNKKKYERSQNNLKKKISEKYIFSRQSPSKKTLERSFLPEIRNDRSFTNKNSHKYTPKFLEEKNEDKERSLNRTNSRNPSLSIEHSFENIIKLSAHKPELGKYGQIFPLATPISTKKYSERYSFLRRKK